MKYLFLYLISNLLISSCIRKHKDKDKETVEILTIKWKSQPLKVLTPDIKSENFCPKLENLYSFDGDNSNSDMQNFLITKDAHLLLTQEFKYNISFSSLADSVTIESDYQGTWEFLERAVFHIQKEYKYCFRIEEVAPWYPLKAPHTKIKAVVGIRINQQKTEDIDRIVFYEDGAYIIQYAHAGQYMKKPRHFPFYSMTDLKLQNLINPDLYTRYSFVPRDKDVLFVQDLLKQVNISLSKDKVQKLLNKRSCFKTHQIGSKVVDSLEQIPIVSEADAYIDYHQIPKASYFSFLNIGFKNYIYVLTLARMVTSFLQSFHDPYLYVSGQDKIGDITLGDIPSITVSDWLNASIILMHYKGYFFNLISSYNENSPEKPAYLLVTLLSNEIMKKDNLSPEESIALAIKIAKHAKFPDIQNYISEKILNEMAKVIMQNAVELVSKMVKEKKEEIKSDIELDNMTNKAIEDYQQSYSNLKGSLGNLSMLKCQAQVQAVAMEKVGENASEAELQRAMDEVLAECEKETKSLAEDFKAADEENEDFLEWANKSNTITKDPFADPLGTLPSIVELYTP